MKMKKKKHTNNTFQLELFYFIPVHLILKSHIFQLFQFFPFPTLSKKKRKKKKTTMKLSSTYAKMYKKKMTYKYSRLQKKYKRLQHNYKDMEKQFDLFKSMFKQVGQQSENSYENIQKGSVAANKQIEDIINHIIQFTPARSFEKLRYYIMFLFCDQMKIERPYADESVRNFCSSFKSEYSETFMKTVETSIKFFKDHYPSPTDIYSMNLGDLIEILCFGNLRNIASRHYEKHLSSVQKKDEIYTVPLFMRDINKAYESMRDACRFLGCKKSTSTVIPPICVLDIEALIEPLSSSFCGSATTSRIPSIGSLLASTHIEFLIESKLQNASIHPYQAIVYEIILFVYTAFMSDLIYVQKTSIFTITSFSNFISKFC